MKYQATIEVEGDPDKLHEALSPESMEYDRSSFNIEKTSEGLKINIQAKDPTALRATLNAITQLLTIHEKMKNGSL